jgi:hypothetical protein
MAENRGGVVPGGESLRSALTWLSERRREEPSAARGKLIDEAALRFDLTPLEVDFLTRQWKEG